MTLKDSAKVAHLRYSDVMTSWFLSRIYSINYWLQIGRLTPPRMYDEVTLRVESKSAKLRGYYFGPAIRSNLCSTRGTSKDCTYWTGLP